MTDNLGEVPLRNCAVLDVLANQQGGTCALLGDESCFYVNRLGKVIQQLEILKQSVKTLEQKEHYPIHWDWTDLFSWLPTRIGAWLCSIL